MIRFVSFTGDSYTSTAGPYCKPKRYISKKKWNLPRVKNISYIRRSTQFSYFYSKKIQNNQSDWEDLIKNETYERSHNYSVERHTGIYWYNQISKQYNSRRENNKI